MVKVVIINKNGDCNDSEMKKILFSELYKKCGFKNNNNFDKRFSWKIVHKKQTLYINVFAKNNGRANTENKFDFPPPIDNELYFGNIVIVACVEDNNEDNVIDITVDMWSKIYESLMGGFENIENTDDEEEEEEEEIPPELLTKHGYKKDGFIVDDEDSSSENDDDDDETDEDEDGDISGDSDDIISDSGDDEMGEDEEENSEIEEVEEEYVSKKKEENKDKRN